jgi:hypothetical protein
MTDPASKREPAALSGPRLVVNEARPVIEAPGPKIAPGRFVPKQTKQQMRDIGPRITGALHGSEISPRRTWLPSVYRDGAPPPPPRCNPSAWIAKRDGVAILAPADYRDEATAQPLSDRQIVWFHVRTAHGTATLTLRAGLRGFGRYNWFGRYCWSGWAVDCVMPAGAAVACAERGWQSEMPSGSVAEVARKLRAAGAERGNYPLIYFAWTGPFSFVFDATARTFRTTA